MADISQELQAILDAIYGEEVRGSIHDAIDLINKVSEVVFSLGTAVTSASSSSAGFYEDSIYLNTDTLDLWKCVGLNTWNKEGNLKGVGIASITKTGTVGLVDTYTITFDDGSTQTYTVTNGAPGNKWYYGTTISGGAVLPTVYPSSGIANANANDAFLNKNEGYIYVCVSGGDANTATWAYLLSLSGGGAATLEDLTDVDVDLTTLANKDILEYDATAGKWKNVSDRSFVRFGGSITFNDLMSGALSTYLTSAYEDMFFTLTTGGTLDATTAAYFTGTFAAGNYLPEDSHIAIINIAPSGSTPSYRFDDFGGYIDISGKADKSEVPVTYSQLASSGQSYVTFSGIKFKTTSAISNFYEHVNLQAGENIPDIKPSVTATSFDIKASTITDGEPNADAVITVHLSGTLSANTTFTLEVYMN